MADKKDKKESLTSLNVAEIDDRLKESKNELFKLHFRHAASALKNPMEIRWMRRTIARLQTIKQQKQTSDKGLQK